MKRVQPFCANMIKNKVQFSDASRTVYNIHIYNYNYMYCAQFDKEVYTRFTNQGIFNILRRCNYVHFRTR